MESTMITTTTKYVTTDFHKFQWMIVTDMQQYGSNLCCHHSQGNKFYQCKQTLNDVVLRFVWCYKQAIMSF